MEAYRQTDMQKKKSVLIIDDEENMRHMLQTMLSRYGYVVTTAPDGAGGLAEIDRSVFDFILCDVKMPQMNGMEFLKTAGDRLLSSTVIMMSAYGSIDMALEAMKLGAYDFISKPFKKDSILFTVKRALELAEAKKENLELRKKLQPNPTS